MKLRWPLVTRKAYVKVINENKKKYKDLEQKYNKKVVELEENYNKEIAKAKKDIARIIRKYTKIGISPPHEREHPYFRT